MGKKVVDSGKVASPLGNNPLNKLKQKGNQLYMVTKHNNKKPLMIGLIAGVAIIVLLSLLFFTDTFVGKAYSGGVNQLGLDLSAGNSITLNTVRTFDVKANVGTGDSNRINGIKFGIKYVSTDLSITDCNSIKSSIDANIVTDPPFVILDTVQCSTAGPIGTIYVEYLLACDPSTNCANLPNGDFKIGEVAFRGDTLATSTSVTYEVVEFHRVGDDPGSSSITLDTGGQDLAVVSAVVGTCGDGTVQTPNAAGVNEVCDDGNTVDGDYCSIDCLTVTGSCGNGVVEVPEVCDDGNIVDDNSCSADCLAFGSTQEICNDGIDNDGDITDNGLTGDDFRTIYLRYVDCADPDCDPGAPADPICNNLNVQQCRDSCANLPVGSNCRNPINCASGICSDGFCIAATCTPNQWSCVGNTKQECDFAGYDYQNRIPCATNEICNPATVSATAGCDVSGLCGNGVLNGGELCDDGDNDNGDGCDSRCDIESGYACSGTPSVCSVTGNCGNGVVDAGESCDDGNLIPNDGCPSTCTGTEYTCSSSRTGFTPRTLESNQVTSFPGDVPADAVTGYNLGIGGTVFLSYGATEFSTFIDNCNVNSFLVESYCKKSSGVYVSDSAAINDLVTSSSPIDCVALGLEQCSSARCRGLPVCGDGEIRSGVEACDDGNDQNDDGCSSSCTIEPTWRCNVVAGTSQCNLCGNGVIEGTEVCDDGNTDGTEGCNRLCTAIIQGYTCPTVGQQCTPICGDGLRKDPEQCDDGNTNNNDGCSSICRVEVPARCGDGQVNQPSEQCDDGNNRNDDVCTNNCRLNVCGDGFARSGVEACDDGDSNNKNRCTNQCTIAVCGDGIIRTDVQPGFTQYENCDDGDTDNNDGCSFNCRIESNYECSNEPSQCNVVGCASCVTGEMCRTRDSACVALGDVTDSAPVATAVINPADLQPVIDHILGRQALTADQMIPADTTCDSAINPADLQPIIDLILGRRQLPLTCPT